MKTYRVIAFSYGDPLPIGIGSFDHPAGNASCALSVSHLYELHNEDDALELGMELEAEMMNHHVIIEEV